MVRGKREIIKAKQNRTETLEIMNLKLFFMNMLK